MVDALDRGAGAGVGTGRSGPIVIARDIGVAGYAADLGKAVTGERLEWLLLSVPVSAGPNYQTRHVDFVYL